jgi:carbamoyl-phosphate synthase small subunit
MPKATLVLKDGTKLQGESFGAHLPCAGEVVFNTGMMGYPESFTDPSYRGQILTLTYPLVGNYGVPGECKDEEKLSKRYESNTPHIKGLIVSEYSENFSHWEAKKSLGDWLKKHNIPAITGIDTRALTQKLRTHGTMLGKIVANKDIEFHDPNKDNLVAEVSVKKPILYKRGPKKIIAVDCGMKLNILRSLLARDITVLRTPWDYDFLKAGDDFDGIFMSNGPGDPAMLEPLHDIIRRALKLKKPIFGICLGNQILALAAGAKTYKLKFGHRAQNQPCQDVDPDSPNFKKCYVTSQNHGFAIKNESLPKDWKVWLKNLNDDTNEGVRHRTLPYFSCQFHPEATPGPTDTEKFFDEFIGML